MPAHPENLRNGDFVTVVHGPLLTTLLSPMMPSPVTVLFGMVRDGEGCAPATMVSRDRTLEGAVLKVLGANAPFVAVAVCGIERTGPTFVLDTRVVDLSHVVGGDYLVAVRARQEQALADQERATHRQAVIAACVQQQLAGKE